MAPLPNSIYMRRRSSAPCSQLKPWAEGGRGAMDLGRRCSHPCLLQGYSRGEFSVPGCLCLFCFGQAALPPVPPCRVDAFPLAHSFFRPFFLAGGRLPIELHAEHTSRAECVRAVWSLRTCCDDGPALCLPCPGGPVWLLARQCGWCDERTKFLI